ncbi:MAG: hypothetical protein SF187_26265 [Deltaproteobacteria bacterium]|nr:hypothetical protein [Deltaproteobacteria bacterium]
MWHGRLAWTCALLAVLAAPVHAAPPATKPVIRIEACADLNDAATRKLLALELGSLAERSTVSIHCDGTTVVLNVTAGERQGSRSMNLAGTDARAWPRILALSAVELLTEPIITPEVAEVAKPSASQPATTIAAVAPAPVRSSPVGVQIALFAGALIRAVPRLQTSTTGLQLGGIGVWPQPLGPWRLGARVAGGFEHGQRSLDAGDGVANAVSALVAMMALRPGRWAPWGSVGLRAGRAWLQGVPTDIATGSSFSAPWLGPEASLGLQWRGVHGLGAGAHVDAGYAAVAAVARGIAPTSSRFGYDGAWFALNISLALQL